MKKLFLSLFIVIGLLTTSGASGNSNTPVSGNHQQKILLCTYSADDAQAVADSQNLRLLFHYQSISKMLGRYYGLYEKDSRDDRRSETIVSELRADQRVRHADINKRCYMDTTPNDPSFGEQWGMSSIQGPSAWNISTGSDNVVIGIVDSGVDYNHSDLKANMWTNAAELNGQSGVDDDKNGYIDDIYGINTFTNTGNAMDDNGHGSHCAGIAGAVGNNGLGVTGVCWKAKIMALKFMDSSGSGEYDGAMKCLDYALAQKMNGQNVVALSNSYGGPDFDDSFQDAIEACKLAGIIFCTSAGNIGDDNDVKPHFPSNFPNDNILTVTMTTDSGGQGGNYGLKTVDLGAPGLGILSTVPGSQFTYMAGTSMACPHVTGAVALMASAFPNESVTARIRRIMNNTTPLSSLEGKCVSGGQLNLFKAISAPPSLIAQFIFNKKSLTSFDFIDQSNGDIVSWQWTFADGSTANQQNPSHTYATGNQWYQVTLKVTDRTGETDSVSAKVWTGNNVMPAADYSFQLQESYMVKFKDLSSDADGRILSWSWNFGDGAASTLQQPSHQFTAGNAFTVVLTVTDNENGTGKMSKIVELPLQYCSSAASSAGADGIAKVEIGTFTHSSGPAAYSNFSNLTVPLNRGQNYPVKLVQCNPNNFSYGWRIWIDFNRNGSFGDAGEKVLEQSSKTDISGSITIPTNAVPGKKMGMRVSVKMSGYRNECETAGWGEVEDYSVILDGNINKQDHFVGSFTNLGVWTLNTVNNQWSQLTPQVASQLACGDFNGNGIDDIIGNFNDIGIWIRYDNGTWEKIIDGTDLIWLSAGDINGDGRADLLGSWTFGVFTRNSATGVWTRLHDVSAGMGTCKDFDKDGKADLLGVWGNGVGIWIRYATGTWSKILDSTDLLKITSGDMNGDKIADVVGSWTHGVWYFQPGFGIWTKIYDSAQAICTGDLDGNGIDDLIGVWNNVPGLWVRFSTGTWKKINDAAPVSMATATGKIY